MPKYIKNKLVTLYTPGRVYYDKMGDPVHEPPIAVERVWANVRGIKYEERYYASGTWVKPALAVTITRPNYEVTTSHYLGIDGVRWDVKAIDDLDAQPRHDIKLYVEKSRDNLPS